MNIRFRSIHIHCLVFLFGVLAAVCAVAHGRGKIIYAGFLPGIAYYRGGAIAKYERDRTEQEEAKQDANALEKDGVPLSAGYVPKESTYNPPSYPEAYRIFFRNLLEPAGYVSPVRISEYLVEGRLLAGESGCLISLANWSGAPKTVNVEVDMPAAPAKPGAVIHPLRNVKVHGNTVSFTIEKLGAGDFILIPLEKKNHLWRIWSWLKECR